MGGGEGVATSDAKRRAVGWWKTKIRKTVFGLLINIGMTIRAMVSQQNELDKKIRHQLYTDDNLKSHIETCRICWSTDNKVSY